MTSITLPSGENSLICIENRLLAERQNICGSKSIGFRNKKSVPQIVERS
jgi:hypothetical protein